MTSPANFPPVAIPVWQSRSSCKVCGKEASLQGVVDMAKNCRELEGLFMELSGIPIYYYRCSSCGFLFSRALDSWTIDDFNRWIYGDTYGLVDPDCLGERPRNFAETLARILDGEQGKISGLDYGGGSGLLSQLMNAVGFNFVSWDPMTDAQETAPSGPFDLITAIEVVEHVPDPIQLFRSVSDRLSDDGIFLFTTQTSDQVPPEELMRWWYVAPLNGHISVMTTAALEHLCASNGLTQSGHFDHIHFTYKRRSNLVERMLYHIVGDPGDA